jgi:hypothetical protein
MNQIGLLFKELNSNDKISDITQELTSDSSIEMKNEVLESIFLDQELMDKLKRILDDEVIIKDKIIAFVNKGLKKSKKKQVSKDDSELNKTTIESEEINLIKEVSKDDSELSKNVPDAEPDNTNNQYLCKYNIKNDLNNPSVAWISPYIRLENIGHFIKMTTQNFECLY